MYERYTERARNVLRLAQDSAKAMKHNYLGTEHLLLGLLGEEEGLASVVLLNLGATYEEVEKIISKIVGQSDKPVVLAPPLTPRTKKVIELALREALSLGHNYIGTEHLLLAMVREGDGVGMRVLSEFDIDADKVRNEVISLVSKPSSDKERVGALEGAFSKLEKRLGDIEDERLKTQLTEFLMEATKYLRKLNSEDNAK